MNSQTQLKTLKITRIGKFLPIAAIGIAGTLYAVNLNRRCKTAVSSHSRMLEHIEQDANHIKLAWKSLNRPYRVFRGEKLIYEGKEPKLVDQNLVPGTLYTYCIETLDDDHGNVKDRMRVQTATSVDFKDRYNISEDLLITTIVSDFDSINPYALLTKATGKTEAFTKEYEPLESESASDEGIQFKKVLTDDESVQFHLNHSVSNPLVVSPAIDYHVCGTFYKDNEFDLVGIHDQSPEHEVYLKEPGTDEWQVIHQAHSKGLEMMADPMANHYWRYSTFTN